jgi:thymidylate synthase
MVPCIKIKSKNMVIYQARTFAGVYEELLNDLINDPEYITKPRDMKINEICDVSLVIENPLSCLYSNPFRSSQSKYIAAEFLWYFMGRNDVEYIAKYAKFWESIKNDDDTVNSSYGHLLFNNKNEHGITQYRWALESLAKDKDSRQAVLHFNLPIHQRSDNKDFVCTMYGIFQIRDNKLNFTISMRSNDVILGLPTDVAFFVTLQSQMLSHLRTHAGYPELELGTYTHIANSSHIYERHFEMAKNMIIKKFEPESMPEVKINLINIDGTPTDSFIALFNNQEEPLVLEDELYNWIINNVNS